MQISLDTPDTQIYIKSYEPGKYIQLNHLKCNRSIIISSEKILRQDTIPQSFYDLTIDHIKEFLSFRADIYLLGTGKNHQIPKQNLLKVAVQKNKALDFMDTNAACRTFNILASEDRCVVAFLCLE